MKCKTCIWANNINEQVILCPFPNCVKINGFLAERCGANDNGTYTKGKDTTSHVDRERMDKGLPVWREDKLPEQDMSVLP